MGKTNKNIKVKKSTLKKKITGGELNGMGCKIKNRVSYVGKFENGKIVKGVRFEPIQISGTVYNGTFNTEGEYDGYGYLNYSYNLDSKTGFIRKSYEGFFSKGHFVEGELWEENFKNWKFRQYNGAFNGDNQFHGKGEITTSDVEYSGNFDNGKPVGIFDIRLKDNTQYSAVLKAHFDNEGDLVSITKESKAKESKAKDKTLDQRFSTYINTNKDIKDWWGGAYEKMEIMFENETVDKIESTGKTTPLL